MGNAGVESFHVLERLFIFQADLVDSLRVGNEAFLDQDVHGFVAPHLFPPFGRFGEYTPIPVDPGMVSDSDCVRPPGCRQTILRTNIPATKGSAPGATVLHP
jgi:hypothetical protein